MDTLNRGGEIVQEELSRVGYCVVRHAISSSACRFYADRLSDYDSGAKQAPRSFIVYREARHPQTSDRERGQPPVRKISGLAVGDSAFRDLASCGSITSLMAGLLGQDLRIFRSDALMKPPEVGSAKGMHQDSTYWPVDPMDLWSCWLPLDAATTSNGCMTLIPGSHRLGPLLHQRVGGEFVVPPDLYDINLAVPIPMSPGDLLIFHGLMIHGTSANFSSAPRRAVVFSYMGNRHRFVGKLPSPEYPAFQAVPSA
jgi:ectoine hydroxylase-related dioxygenase (phytanoyl-CoA dioxygenase family)